jgi:hypothetical protein
MEIVYQTKKIEVLQGATETLFPVGTRVAGNQYRFTVVGTGTADIQHIFGGINTPVPETDKNDSIVLDYSGVENVELSASGGDMTVFATVLGWYTRLIHNGVIAMPAGRPTKYTPELVAEAREYITGYREHGHAIPSIQGMCIVLNIGETTAYDYAQIEGNEFADILRTIKSHQHHALINGGLTGELNSNITKLVLGKHGYSDKADNTHSGPDGGPIEVDSHWTVEVVEPGD